ncbi:arginine--tRNA ligase [Suttonella sp. R2A3]|uniref:arginine--tRNA ligase n=1 Tax=Suttonella sp. R2A3 TaxID=2908648 RepID=UPI001F02F4D5|nr:arginine--tRNA ligase [Suttonella sp. R2A3]UJF23650.1 arginine--tRNA ligase [Suttonella sp. R2A3]
MKQEIEQGLSLALLSLAGLHEINESALPKEIEVSRTNNPEHGDFQSNIALKSAKAFSMKPRELADLIVVTVPLMECVAGMEVAGPGFINIRLSRDSETAVLSEIVHKGDLFGHHQPDSPQKVLIEFVSANPTGPLHVGHGRGAAYGATLANVLRANGHEVDCEYYVNDAGRQMDILALSVYWRYLEANDAAEALPSGLYQGEYVRDLAASVQQRFNTSLVHTTDQWLSEAPRAWSQEEADNGTRDQWIDQAIADMKALLGADQYRAVFDIALNLVLDDIRDDLAEFGVHFDRWYSERSLFEHDLVKKTLTYLDKEGFLYEDEGATWFCATEFGDEKDRVVQRDNGAPTYFASDIAYHLDKYERGYDQMIDIFGADHHGYMARVRASLAALGLEPSKLTIALVQFAVLYRGGEKMQMSTRSGQFVTLRELRDTVGNDAARFFYAMRKPEQHLDFDLDLAMSHSKDNPFYYVQYAHARTCRMLARAQEEHIEFSAEAALPHRRLLSTEAERAIIRELARFPEVVAHAGIQYTAHGVVNYLKDLASAWHQFYDAGHKVLHDDEALRAARLLLTQATQQVLRNGLAIIGVDALERM